MEAMTEISNTTAFLDEEMDTFPASFSDCAGTSTDDLPHPVFKNGLILDAVFNHLSFEDLKQCRAVNKCWKEVSETVFQRKSQVVTSKKKTPKQFFSDFEKNQIKCGCYKFRYTECLLSDFMNVFRRDSSGLSSLKLDLVTLNDKNGKKILKLDLGALLEEHKMLKRLEVSCMLTTLSMTSYLTPAWLFTMMTLPQEKLLNIEYLNLSQCVIILGNSPVRCAPKEIALIEMLFHSPTGEELSRVLINDFLDTKYADKIKIVQHSMEYCHLNLLDSREHPMTSAWLCGISFKISPHFKLKRLYVGKQNIDISILPNSLEAIQFDLEANNQLYESSPAFSWNRFTKLKELRCAFVNQIPPLLSKFSTCPQLQYVTLEKENTDDVPCKLNWLPSSLKVLILGNINDICDDEEPAKLNVNTLLLHNCAPNAILKILRTVHAENLYIIFRLMGHLSENSQICRTILQEKLFGKYFTVGRFEWFENEFLSDPLSCIVSKRSTSYSFDTQQNTREVDENILFPILFSIKHVPNLPDFMLTLNRISEESYVSV